jgi:hypothetical protein
MAIPPTLCRCSFNFSLTLALGVRGPDRRQDYKMYKSEERYGDCEAETPHDIKSVVSRMRFYPVLSIG